MYCICWYILTIKSFNGLIIIIYKNNSLNEIQLNLWFICPFLSNVTLKNNQHRTMEHVKTNTSWWNLFISWFPLVLTFLSSWVSVAIALCSWQDNAERSHGGLSYCIRENMFELDWKRNPINDIFTSLRLSLWFVWLTTLQVLIEM